MTKLLLYIGITPIVIFALDSININNIFKKNKIFQARVFYLLLALSITYLIVNYIYDFITNIKIF